MRGWEVRPHFIPTNGYNEDVEICSKLNVKAGNHSCQKTRPMSRGRTGPGGGAETHDRRIRHENSAIMNSFFFQYLHWANFLWRDWSRHARLTVNNKLIENEACLQLVFDLLVRCTKAVQVVGCPPFGRDYSGLFMVRVRVCVQETQHIKLNTIYFVQSCNYYDCLTCATIQLCLAVPTSIDITFLSVPCCGVDVQLFNDTWYIMPDTLL